jgi:acetyl esterase/lipase
VTQLTRRAFAVMGSAAAAVSAVLASIPAPAALFAAGSDVGDPMSFVDPELRGPLESLLRASKGFDLNSKTLMQARAGAKTPAMPSPPVFERRVPGPKFAPDVRVFTVSAVSQERIRPAILYLHGGGFVMGSGDDDLPTLQKLALDHQCVVVSVDYRLAPETRFPGALEDNYAALKWLHGNADELGVDRARIAVMGGSSGGGHAAMLSIAARDRGEIPVRFQVLLCPMLDDRTGSIRQPPPHIGAFVWKRGNNRFGWDALLGAPPGSREPPAGAVPARVANLRGLPPTFIGVGAIDLFVDEIAFAQRLVDAGVPTELIVVPGAYHGFEVIAPDTVISKRYRAWLNQSLSRALAAEATEQGL